MRVERLQSFAVNEEEIERKKIRELSRMVLGLFIRLINVL